MSQKANKTLIGAFVVGAIVLAIAAIVIFGSGRLFSQTHPFVLYFDGSINGLSIGAPVTFRGVKIGSVTDIRLRLEGKEMNPRIPIFVEFEPERISEPHGVSALEKLSKGKNIEIKFKQLVEKGLRAQLVSQSFVTGQLMVQLDFAPDKPAKYVGVDPEFAEIPTIPSPIQEFSQTIQNIPLDQIANDLLQTIKGIEEVVNSHEFRQSITEVRDTIVEVKKLVQQINERTQSLGPNLEQVVKDINVLVNNANDELTTIVTNMKDTSVAAQSTLNAAEKALTSKDGSVSQFTMSVKETTKSVQEVLDQAKKTLVTIEEISKKSSPVSFELRETLKELTKTARSLRVMLEYLEQHPESLIFGKGNPGGK